MGGGSFRSDQGVTRKSYSASPTGLSYRGLQNVQFGNLKCVWRGVLEA